ncbi:MAG: hypothetical protein HY720_06300 [Planctomycetes bacterium]|nr:hypothetical protein [Planctomycetota bacterium]
MIRTKSRLFSLALAALATAPVLADEAPVPSAEAKVLQVSLFKNGLAYVELEVAVPANDGWIAVVPPSLPLHGSFWVAHDPARLEVKEVVAERIDVDEEEPADSVAELLRANVGRECVLRSGDRELRGTLLAYPGTELPAAVDGESAWPGQEDASRSPGSLVILKTHGGTVGIDPGTVQSVVFEGEDARLAYTNRKKESRLRVRVGEGSEGKTFLVQYLAHGAAWAPSYRLDLVEEGKARIEARTDVLNDLMDLEGVPARLVSGFPNLRFVHVQGALALRTTLDEFIGQLSSEPYTPMRREMVQAQSVYSNAAFQAETGLATATSRGFEGEAAEDMFFSKLGEVSLDKGSRGNYPLFAAEVPCEQIFRWEIADYLNQQGYYQSREDEDRPEEVWHSLRLTNTTASPWTTAPATVTKGGAVLGQDVCFYTASGGKTLVKVTKALNIQAEEQEHEVNRKQQAEQLYGYYYDLVTIEGTLYLCSYKNHDVVAEIAKTLSGELIEAGENPEVVKLGRGLHQVNPVNRLNWRLTLPSAKEVRIVYKYEVLVRR